MKAKVLVKFIDKNTDKVCKEGSTINVTKERFEEINKTGVEKGLGNLIEEVVVAKDATATEKKASK